MPVLSPRHPSFLVVGSGCVGSYLATTLGKNGASVTLKARGPPKTPIAKLAAKAGVEVVTDLAPLARAIGAGDRPPLDAIFVATKTYSFEDVANQLVEAGPSLRPRLATVGCYNGHVLGAKDLFGQIGAGSSAGPSVFCKALVPGGYSIKEDGSGFNVTNAGQKWSLLSTTPEVRQLAKHMASYGVATVAGGFEADTRKYLVNNTANLVSVIANTNCNGLINDPALLARMRSIFRETAEVLRAAPAHREHFPSAISLHELEEQVLSGIASYAEHYPSSCKDFRAGQPIEVSSLNGYICALGEQLGMDTPVNKAVVDDVSIVLRQHQQQNADAEEAERAPTAPKPQLPEARIRRGLGARIVPEQPASMTVTRR